MVCIFVLQLIRGAPHTHTHPHTHTPSHPQVLPLLAEIRLNDVNILITVLGKNDFNNWSKLFVFFLLLGKFFPVSEKKKNFQYGKNIFCPWSNNFSAEIYRVMLSDRKYGLTVTLLATRSLLKVIVIIFSSSRPT